MKETWSPGSLVVEAQVPGIDPDRDADITVTGNQLQLTVRHEEKTEHKDKEGYRSEFRHGTFSRTMTLPAAIDPGDVKASYTDGILEIRVPVPEQGAPEVRKIPIFRTLTPQPPAARRLRRATPVRRDPSRDHGWRSVRCPAVSWRTCSKAPAPH